MEIVEPAKQLVRTFEPGDPIDRQVRVVLWRLEPGDVFVAVISLTRDSVIAWDQVEGVQPNATVDE